MLSTQNRAISHAQVDMVFLANRLANSISIQVTLDLGQPHAGCRADWSLRHLLQFTQEHFRYIRIREPSDGYVLVVVAATNTLFMLILIKILAVEGDIPSNKNTKIWNTIRYIHFA